MANTEVEKTYLVEEVGNKDNGNEGTVRMDDVEGSGIQKALEPGEEGIKGDRISFLDLAFELRTQIYQEVASQDPDGPPFELRAPTYHDVGSRDPVDLPLAWPTRGSPSRYSGKRITRSIDGLVLANRQVGEEAKAAYYGRKTFDVEFGWVRLYGRSPFLQYGMLGNLRPDVRFAQHCEVHIRLPLRKEDLLRPIKMLFVGRTAPTRTATGAPSAETAAKGLNPSLKSLKLSIHGTGNRLAPRSSELEANLRKRNFYIAPRDIHREVRFYNDNKAFASEKQLRQIVAAFTARVSKETMVELELWNAEGKLEIMPSVSAPDPVSSDALCDFWAALEL